MYRDVKLFVSDFEVLAIQLLDFISANVLAGFGATVSEQSRYEQLYELWNRGKALLVKLGWLSSSIVPIMTITVTCPRRVKEGAYQICIHLRRAVHVPGWQHPFKLWMCTGALIQKSVHAKMETRA